MKCDHEKLISPSFGEFYKLSIDIWVCGYPTQLTELEADNWKHRSNSTVTLTCVPNIYTQTEHSSAINILFNFLKIMYSVSYIVITYSAKYIVILKACSFQR